MSRTMHPLRLIVISTFMISGFLSLNVCASQEEQFHKDTGNGISPPKIISMQSPSDLKDENKENVLPLPSRKEPRMKEQQIPQSIQNIIQHIQNGLTEGDTTKVAIAYRVFKELNYEEEIWKAFAQALKAQMWPSQSTWKEAVGGSLFFPSEIVDWELSHDQDYRLERLDAIWSLAIWAKFNHPLSAYYLAKVLDALHSNVTGASKPNFLFALYNQALETLEKCENHPDACYILGESYFSTRGVLLTLNRFNPEKSLLWHSKGKDLKNQYAILNIRNKSHPSPTLEEYRQLARSGYKLAYLNAAELASTLEEKLSILNEAVEQDYTPALMVIGKLYKKAALEGKGSDYEGLIAEARKYYEEAGKRGIARACLLLGITYVGHVPLERKSLIYKEKILNLSPEIIKKAASLFRQAGEEGRYPEGWEYLAQLHLIFAEKAAEELRKINLSAVEEEKKEARETYEANLSHALSALHAGVMLGSQEAHHEISFLYSKEKEVLEEIWKKWPPTYKSSFYKTIESFLSNTSYVL